jgi:hypothetical protein
MEKKQTVFERLSAINVNDHVEKKSNLTYLSWAWAWAVTKRECPDATYKILETEFDETLGFMCHTTVTIEGETLEMWLPVMDGANKSMLKKSYSYTTRYGEKTVESATTFDINKTIMRCLVKNLAMFGLGIYIYAGEDLPEGETAVAKAPETKAPAQEKKLTELKKGTVNWDAVVNYVTANKALGLEKIGGQLNRKYSMTPAIKKEIANLINAQ